MDAVQRPRLHCSQPSCYVTDNGSDIITVAPCGRTQLSNTSHQHPHIQHNCHTGPDRTGPDLLALISITTTVVVVSYHAQS